jgi:hypothetical protein
MEASFPTRQLVLGLLAFTDVEQDHQDQRLAADHERHPPHPGLDGRPRRIRAVDHPDPLGTRPVAGQNIAPCRFAGEKPLEDLGARHAGRRSPRQLQHVFGASVDPQQTVRSIRVHNQHRNAGHLQRVVEELPALLEMPRIAKDHEEKDH